MARSSPQPKPAKAASASGGYTSNPFTIFGNSFKALFAINFSVLLGLLALVVGSLIVGAVVAGVILSRADTLTRTVLLAVLVLLGVAWVMIMMGALTKYALATMRGKPVALSTVLETGYQKALGLFGLLLLTSLIVVAGLILFIIPGLIFMYWFLLAPYIYVDQNLSITGALKESRRLMKPRAVENLGLLSAGVLLSLPGLLPLIGLFYQFFFNASYYIAWAYRYDSRKAALARGRLPPAADSSNWWAIGLGVAASILLMAGTLAVSLKDVY